MINSAVAKMTAAQRAIYQANLPKVSRPAQPVSNLTLQTVEPSKMVLRIKTNRHPVVHSVRDEALVTRRNARIEAVKKAYGGTIPTK